MMRLAEGSPAWGGAIAGVVAIAVFVVFSAWVVVHRVRHGKDSNDE
jgi:fumarate reductase subunit D